MKREIKSKITLENLSYKVDGLSSKFDKGFASVNKAIEKLAISTAKGFTEMNDRFEQVDKRFEQVDERFDQVDRRFDRIEKDLNIIKTDVAILKTDLRTVDAKYPPWLL